MPRRSKKTLTAFRIEPELLKAVQEAAAVAGTNVTAIVEDGLRTWLAREKRRQPKPDPLARHLYPTTARETAARTGVSFPPHEAKDDT